MPGAGAAKRRAGGVPGNVAGTSIKGRCSEDLGRGTEAVVAVAGWRLAHARSPLPGDARRHPSGHRPACHRLSSWRSATPSVHRGPPPRTPPPRPLTRTRPTPPPHIDPGRRPGRQSRDHRPAGPAGGGAQRRGQANGKTHIAPWVTPSGATTHDDAPDEPQERLVPRRSVDSAGERPRLVAGHATRRQPGGIGPESQCAVRPARHQGGVGTRMVEGHLDRPVLGRWLHRHRLRPLHGDEPGRRGRRRRSTAR